MAWPLLPTRPYCGENGRRPPRLVSGFLFLVLGRLYGEVGGRPRGSERRQWSGEVGVGAQKGVRGVNPPFWGIGESSVLMSRSYFCVKIARQVQVLARAKVRFKGVPGHDTWCNGQLDTRACEWAWLEGEEGREMGVRTLSERNVSAHRVSLCRDTHPPVTLASSPLPLITIFFPAVYSLFSPFYLRFHLPFRISSR